MKSGSIKFLLLAAGEGSRLRPLTQQLPKPLVCTVGLPMACYTLNKAIAQLNKFSTQALSLAINAFYKADKISAFANDYFPNLYVSLEKEKIGTGGAMHQLKPWLGENGSLVVHSGDVLSTMDLTALVDHHLASKAFATIYVVPHVLGETAIDVVDGQLMGFGTGRFTFANAYVLSPEFMKTIPSGFSDIIQTFKQALNLGKNIQALTHHGYWANLNNLQEFIKLNQTICSDKSLRKSLYIEETLNYFGINYKFSNSGFCINQTNVEQLVLGENVILNSPIQIEQTTANLSHCVLLPGSVINQSSIHNKILGPGFCLDI